MLELLLAFLLCAVMAKVADSEGLSGLLWGCLTFIVVLGSLVIPIPFLRLGIALVAMFVILTVYKIVAKV